MESKNSTRSAFVETIQEIGVAGVIFLAGLAAAHNFNMIDIKRYFPLDEKEKPKTELPTQESKKTQPSLP